MNKNHIKTSFFNTNQPLGIQLWTLKEAMKENPKKTLDELATIGYQQIELFQGENGILFGMKPKEFLSVLNDRGLNAKSAHCDPFNNFEKTLETALEVGLEYLVCAWLGPNNSLDFYKKALNTFNKCSELCYDNGLKFAYHNHDYSLKPVEGVVPQTMFMTQTDKNKMVFEMDVYWVVMANQDPMTWIKNYPDSWKMVHLKDMSKNVINDEKVSVPIGTGAINYEKLLPQFKEFGINDFYVEQEYFNQSTPIEDCRKSYNYLMSL